MTIKLYTFRFSPPARLAHLVAKIIEVDHQQVEVDLSKVMMMVVMVMNDNDRLSWVGSTLTLHSQDKGSSNFPG